MPGVVVDKHAIVWFLSRDSRLSARARDVLRSTTANAEVIHVPSICLVELTYLAEKGRLPAVARDELIQALDDPATPCSRLHSIEWSPMLSQWLSEATYRICLTELWLRRL